VPPLDEIDNARPYLGHLLIVTRRLVARLGDLTNAESEAVGRAAAQLARALTQMGGAEWVYAAVIGTGVSHFHLHLVPRYPGTPSDNAWYESTSGRAGLTAARTRSSSSSNDSGAADAHCGSAREI
jgi:diadenosine tetraphosphate (Ap4A) HIT family hydrolase